MELTHMNDEGRAKMVDVSNKSETKRIAIASGNIWMKKETIDVIREGKAKKGDVLAVAQVAGIMAAKRTSEIIPMCHNIGLDGVDIGFVIHENNIEISATVKVSGRTGVEMEALSAVTAAALTIYDMVKAVDKDMIITDIRLLEKHGGKTDYIREEAK